VQRIIVITGTDTGVGKTLLTALLTAHLAAKDVNVAALKPLCSGGRDDARLLRRALGNRLTLDTINPWHFPTPIAPLLAARKAGRVVALREVTSHVRTIALNHEIVLVEGAGGLLSPLGEKFSTRELITALKAEVILVAANKLGVMNHVRLTLAALPRRAALRTRIVLMSPPHPDAATRTNVQLLGEFVAPEHVTTLPWFRNSDDLHGIVAQPRVSLALAALL
jgi:dethiobiotin synthetase